MNEFLPPALVKCRDVLAGELEAARAKARHLFADPAALAAAIRQLDPAYPVDAIAAPALPAPGWTRRAGLILAGRVRSEMIVLRDPRTGEVKECRTNSGASFFPVAQTMTDNSSTRSCAGGCQRAGFVRMN